MSYHGSLVGRTRGSRTYRKFYAERYSSSLGIGVARTGVQIGLLEALVPILLQNKVARVRKDLQMV